jgi:hypothetical protein
VKIRYTPPSGGAAARLKPVDWFTPFTDAERTGHVDDAADHHAVPTPTNHRPHDHHDVDQMWADMDLASGGPVLIAASKTVLGAGKDGIAYSQESDASPDLGSSPGSPGSVRPQDQYQLNDLRPELKA